MYSIGLASIFAVIVLVLPLELPLNLLGSFYHQATWLVGLRQVLDIVQGLYHRAPKVSD
jgi:hypothetical protein